MQTYSQLSNVLIFNFNEPSKVICEELLRPVDLLGMEKCSLI